MIATAIVIALAAKRSIDAYDVAIRGGHSPSRHFLIEAELAHYGACDVAVEMVQQLCLD
jgi:hypothetical protein